jgi:hypothetical protein
MQYSFIGWNSPTISFDTITKCPDDKGTLNDFGYSLQESSNG